MDNCFRRNKIQIHPGAGNKSIGEQTYFTAIKLHGTQIKLHRMQLLLHRHAAVK